MAAQIQLQGAQVLVYDPKAMDNARALFPTLDYRPSAVDAAKSANVLFHIHRVARVSKETDPAHLGDVVTDRRIVYGRNALDPARWRAADCTYRALGGLDGTRASPTPQRIRR